MANRAPSILSISYDESLLRTREWLLRASGFTVTSALGFTEAAAHCRNSDFDLVIAPIHYRIAPAPNVLRIGLPLLVPEADRLSSAAEKWLGSAT